jgi:hypothetical protein
MAKRNSFGVPNTSTPLQTALAAVAHLADGEFLVEKQTVNKERL